MGLKLAVHPSARADLVDIWRWTATRWGAQKAEAYLAGLQATMDLLLYAPDLARARHEFLPPMRLFPYQSHVVLYRVSDERLIVHRIVHRRANWQAFNLD